MQATAGHYSEKPSQGQLWKRDRQEGAMPGCHGIAGLGKRAQEMDPLTQQTADQDAGQLRAKS